MGSYRDWLFFVPVILAVIFMIWVLFKFTKQLGDPGKSTAKSHADSRYLHVVTAASPEARLGLGARDSRTRSAEESELPS